MHTSYTSVCVCQYALHAKALSAEMQASGDKISIAEVRQALQGPNGRNAESITYGDFEEIMSQQQQPNRGEDEGSESAKDRPYPLATRLQASQPSQTKFPQLGGFGCIVTDL